MTAQPRNPKIYHFTNIENLANILQQGFIWSDAETIARSIEIKNIGLNSIKKRRLEKNNVKCHFGTKVGEYVPFYFCPRSVMLYFLHKGNNPDLSYRDGQELLIHFQADLFKVVEWAKKNKNLWAFCDRNASTSTAIFFGNTDHLPELNWDAINSTDFTNESIKTHKQAEFLLHRACPWSLVEEIGVYDELMKRMVSNVLSGTGDTKSVWVKKEWYY